MKHWTLSVTVVAVLCGALVALQFKAQAVSREALPTRRVEELVVMVKDAEAEHRRLTARVETLTARVKDPGHRPAARKPARWGALTGPGVEVVITDSAKPLTKGENPNLAIVHNEDLLRVVNELKAAGAEAVSVNDQRLVESSEVTCAGPTILVNQTRLAPPFVIRAIGNAETLFAALGLRGGVVEYLQFYGIQVTITRKLDVLVPMYHGGSAYQFAKPIPTQPSS